MFVVSVTVFSFLQAVILRMLGSRERTLAQQTVLTLDSLHAFVLSLLIQPSDALNYYAALLACRSKLSKRSAYLADVSRAINNGKSWTEL